MRILSIIQPSEMGPDFRFDEEAGLWKVNFPAGMGEGGGVPLSTDENNAIVLGSDEGAFISADLLGAYALTQDNGSKKINLYRFQPGTEFNPETAALVSSVNMVELSGIFDDVAIDGDLITFTDAQTGLTLTIDTANLQKVSDIVGSDSVEVNSLDGLTTLSVKINPHPDNLIKATEEGLFVDAANFGGGDLDLHQTLAQVEEGLCHVVGDSHLVVPQIELTDVAGNPIGYINDIIGLPVSSQTHGPDHCPKWEPPAVNNCRVGKVAVAFDPNFMYGPGPENSIEWRIFMNGVDTGYIAAVPELASPPGVEEPMLMSLTQEDLGDGNDFIGKGWLQDIIGGATNGAVSGSYHDGATLLNETNQQVILTLVPNRPITLDEVRSVYNGGEGGNIYELTLDQITNIRNSSGGGPVGPVGPGTVIPAMLSSDSVTPMNLGDGEVVVPMESLPTIAVLEDYFDEETGVINICLAPNNSGNGGSTGPQISSAGATDRFATSSLWYKWTVKLNGKTLVQNAPYSDVIQALESKGIRVGYEGEMRTTYRNLTNENIRLEFIAGTPDNQRDQIYLELDKSTNPTLMGYDPLQNNAEMAMMAFNSKEEDSAPVRYQRLTVCLAPANDWMNWEYNDIDTSTAVITLRNSVNLTDANQDFRVEGEHSLELETGIDEWGDLTWTIHANEPQRREVILTIDHPDHQDEFTVDFFARKPMVVTLANTNEYAKTVNVASYIAGNTIDIVSVEVATANGFTTVTELDDGLVIDLKVGSLRIDNLAEGMFSYILQGRFVGIELIETVKVKFVTETGAEEIAEVELNADNFEGEFIVMPESTYKKVTIGVVDPNHYTNLNDLPAINLEIPEWASTVMKRINGLGAEDTLEINFKEPGDTHQLYIKAYLNGAQLAVLGSCVVGVDDWGDLEAGGYTFNQETYARRFDQDLGLDFITVSKNNLSYLPKEGPVGMGSMVGMFAGTDLSDPSVDLSGYDVGGVYSMVGVFAHSNFNGNILSWNMRWVRRLDYAFYASKFRQDLSLWCVSNISSEPKLFSHRAPLLAKHKPVWGTCPLQDETSQVTLRNSAGHGVELRKAAIPNDYSRDNPAIYSSKYIALMCYKPLLIIGDRAFKDQLISELSFIPNLKQIGNEAFMNNQLETVTIYGGITKIGDGAFAGNPLRFVGVIENTPPVLGVDAIPTSVEGIYVPDSVVAKYKSADGWSNYAEVIKPLSTATGIVYTVTYDETRPETKYTFYFISTVIPEDFLENRKAIINSINEGVTTVGSDGLFGNSANYLKIPSSLTTVDGAGLSFSAQILEFEEGRVDTAFMVDSRPDANVVILPSTMSELTGWVISNVPRVIVSKAAVPPTLGVWNAYRWSANNIEYRSSLGSWHSYSGTGCEALYVPAGSIEAYRADPRWTMYTANILPLDELDYGNVKKIKMTASGSNYQVNGTADLASVGKEVTIRYYESLYNSNTGRNVPTNVLSYSAIVGADGTFNVNVPMRDTLANHYIDAVIGAGNLLVTNSYA